MTPGTSTTASRRLARLAVSAGHSLGPRISGRPPSMGRTSGVTWLLTNIPKRAATIPTTAPVCALLQVHHWKAMPSAIKASTRAWNAADSCLTHFTIWFSTFSTFPLHRSTLLHTDRSAEVVPVSAEPWPERYVHDRPEVCQLR